MSDTSQSFDDLEAELAKLEQAILAQEQEPAKEDEG